MGEPSETSERIWLENAIEERDQEIVDKRAQIERLNAEFEEKRRENEKMQRENEELMREIDREKAELIAEQERIKEQFSRQRAIDENKIQHIQRLLGVLQQTLTN
jgi:hypothetical protein